MRREFAQSALDISTPVLILGGKENSLAIARNLGRHGITVRVSGPANCWGMHSRYCRESFAVPFGGNSENFWKELLLSPGAARLHGHILFPCSDDSIEFIAKYRDELSRHYLLDVATSDMQRDLLDKRRTLQLAAKAGVDAPRYWQVKCEADIDALKGIAVFPLLVKPIHSHKFSRILGQKLFIVEGSFDELKEKASLALSRGLEIMIVEMIPGPDDLLSSYYTYVSEDGQHLFHFTKRVLRRYPVNRGNACYHITEWLPETAKAGRKFFDAIGLRGLGNVEFKLDLRDGKLKLIEVNARFTAAHQLLVSAGAPIDLVVYCDLTRQPAPVIEGYAQRLRFWYPLRDFLAFLDLRKQGTLTFFNWLKSIARIGHVSPLWSIWDPWPAAGAGAAIIQRLLRGQE
jgi:predicted ATP-grasp superfamily ATP-dependent carboligase